MQASPLWARSLSPLVALITLALALVLICSGCGRLQASAGGGAAEQQGTGAGSAGLGRLQEVAPPAATNAVVDRLGEHDPQVEILAPADDSLLGDGPWTLQLRVRDWPISDGGELGLGPHLVVQVDQHVPLRIGDSTAAAAITMPPLQPGSHRITVYAARPWGEAVKSPGAMRQIRVHRVGRNAAELPERGSAQLIVASPDGLQQQEPVLIDWLLIDAPLQHLRDDDARWRLRISVNGDSFLVDRQTPLWLKGFRRGSNAVQLELLDGHGEPLNPPFNSLVREVLIGGSERPAWQRPTLAAGELALLSGEPQEPEVLAATTPASPSPTAGPGSSSTQTESSAIGLAEPNDQGEDASHQEPMPPPSAPPEEKSITLPGAVPAATPIAAEQQGAEVRPAPPAEAEADRDSTGESGPIKGPVGGSGREPEKPADLAATPQPSTASEPTTRASTQADPAPPSNEIQALEPPPTRISAGTSLSGSARDQVSADGSLLKPKGRGPLAGLREKLGG